MNKYSLTFKDSNTEKEYLQQKWIKRRKNDFKYISISVDVVYLIKVIMALLSQNYSFFIYKIIFFFYTLIQYMTVRKQPEYARIALIILNTGIIITKLESDASMPDDVVQLKNLNLILAFIMISLSGEFVDAAIQFFTIIIIIVIYIAIVNSISYYHIILTTSIVGLFMIKYLYQYHQGQRSAFLLGNVDNQWDKVLYQLIPHSYILLDFDYTNLDYIVINQSKFPFQIQKEQLVNIKNSRFQEAQYFMQAAQVGNMNMQDFIFKEIKDYQQNFTAQYSQQIHIKFQKQLALIDYSIFKAKELKILLQIKSIKPQNTKQIKHYQERFLKYNAMFIKLLNEITFYQPNNRTLLKVKEKLSFILNYEEIMQQKLSIKSLNICQFIVFMQSLYPSIKIRFESNLSNCSFLTFPNIFVLLIMIVINSSRKDYLYFNFLKKESDDLTSLEITGQFKLHKLKKYYQVIQTQINLIIYKSEISESCIELIQFRFNI